MLEVDRLRDELIRARDEIVLTRQTADHFARLLARCKRERSGEVLEVLRAMVSAQHAGPITDEMYAAWERARALLQATDVTPGGHG